MRLSRYLVAVLGLLMLGAPLSGSASAQAFQNGAVAKDAERYEASVKAGYKAGTGRNAVLKATAEKQLAADPRAAAASLAQAAVNDPKDAEAWIGLARALLAIKADRGNERYELPVSASGAAYIGYERAQSPAAKARALALLADALKRRSMWRPAIESLKASVALVDDPAVRKAYEALRAEKGFRITDHKVDVEASTPRLCVQLSEPLSRGQVDFAKFVTVDGKDPQGVVAEGQQLCVEGLRHGQRYEVNVREGLPSDVGETLLKSAEISVYVRDRSPTVRFTGRAYVLPSRGQQGIPVVSINTDRVGLEVYRIGDRALAQAVQSGDLQRSVQDYELQQIREQTGQRIFQGEMDVASRLNEEVTTAFPVTEAIGAIKPGVYLAVARPAAKTGGGNGDDSLASQWFVVSDLGLTAMTGDDGIHAFVRSLATADPVGSVRVRLLARNNEVLGEARTDVQGYARFDPALRRGEGGAAPAVLVAEGTGTDYAFLDLTLSAFDLSDRGVKGREAPGPLDGYLFPERGVYRPGETVHLTALVRDKAASAATLPVTLILTRPDGVEHRRLALPDQGVGGRSASIALAASAMTGTWRAKLHADPKADPIAQAAFLVEDFLPERLDLKLEPMAKALVVGEEGKLKVSGRYLYGPPAADLAIEADVVVKASAKDLEGYAGYRFGLADEKIAPSRKTLEDLPATGADGTVTLPVTLPAVPRTASPLEADVVVRLREPGGRTIERTTTLPVDLREPRVGIRPLADGGSVPEGETAQFDVILLDGTGQRMAAKEANWQLLRLETSWQWYRRDGGWAYDAVTLTRKVGSGTLAVAADAPARIAAKVDYGRYRLEVSSAEAGGALSSLQFTAGWYAAADQADSPEMLEVALDKASYKPGDTARLRIASRTGGKALIAVLGAGLLTTREVAVAKGGAEVAFPVGQDWGAGAYVTVALYRPMDEAGKRMPSRAVGVTWLGLDQASRTIGVKLDLPEKVRSGATLSVPVKLSNLAGGEEARVTIAAVDVGILNLTRYQAPKPESHYYAQRKMGHEIRDLYGRLIDGMRAERGRLRTGGDGGGGMSMQGSPPVEAIVALYSGIVRIAPDGTAKVDFKLPEFNGAIRVMAVAWTKDKLGSATGDVIVRDPLALIASGPRFLTLGDEARLGLDLHNVEGPVGMYTAVVAEAREGASPTPVVTREVSLAANQRKSERFVVKPAEVGLVTYDVRVAGPGGVEIKRALTFDVKPPAGDIRRTTVSTLAGNGGRLTLSADLVGDLIKSRSRVNLSVGPIAGLDVPGLLTSLDRYPYGCAEQTVSRALPLLYVNAVARQIGLAQDAEIRTRITGAVDRVLGMQDASGAFGVWGPWSADLWLTSYVTDFLTRAREAGIEVKREAFAQALDKLQAFVAYTQDFAKDGEARAYALYVLARNGRAPIGELRYFADTRLDKFPSPLARAHLGAALAMMGDKDRAERVFAAAMESLDQLKDEAFRTDYGSKLRDGAAILTLASETSTARAGAARLTDVIAKAYQAKAYTSTQEQAWMLLAANALAQQGKELRLTVGDAPHSGPLTRAFSPAELAAQPVTVANTGAEPTDAHVTVLGAALTPEPAVSRGFTIERSYFGLDGKPVDLKSAAGGTGTLKQNDRLVVVLKIAAPQTGGRILVVDRLPAGLEIENPRLVEGGDLKALDWLETTVKPEHAEFRDDRFVAAFNFFGGTVGRRGDDDGEAQKPVSAATVAYIVRAVTPGSFVHPAATVEDMYRPERHARTAAGRLVVEAGR